MLGIVCNFWNEFGSVKQGPKSKKQAQLIAKQSILVLLV